MRKKRGKIWVFSKTHSAASQSESKHEWSTFPAVRFGECKLMLTVCLYCGPHSTLTLVLFLEDAKFKPDPACSSFCIPVCPSIPPWIWCSFGNLRIDRSGLLLESHKIFFLQLRAAANSAASFWWTKISSMFSLQNITSLLLALSIEDKCYWCDDAKISITLHPTPTA